MIQHSFPQFMTNITLYIIKTVMLYSVHVFHAGISIMINFNTCLSATEISLKVVAGFQ